MKLIDDTQRRKIFGLVKTAHERSGCALDLEGFRHEQMDALGIESLSRCPAEKGLQLMNRLHRIIGNSKLETGNWKQPHEEKPKRAVKMEYHPREPQLRKIYALLTNQDLTWEYADGISLHMFKVPKVEQLNGRQMGSVITALTVRQKKHGGRREYA